MTLRTDFFDGACGFDTQMNDVFDQGVIFVACTILAALTTAMTTNAAKGVKTFQHAATATFETANLRLCGIHQARFFDGMTSALYAQDVYTCEYSLKIDKTCCSVTKINICFTF